MIKGKCCTFTPNNMASDGTITKDLQWLTTLASELVKNSGIDDTFTNLKVQWFKKWKGMVASIFLFL
jgi:hypothetical protein